jgi:hypothetical protein
MILGLILGDFAQILRVPPQLASDSHLFPIQLGDSPVREVIYLFWPKASSEHKQNSHAHTLALSCYKSSEPSRAQYNQGLCPLSCYKSSSTVESRGRAQAPCPATKATLLLSCRLS